MRLTDPKLEPKTDNQSMTLLYFWIALMYMITTNLIQDKIWTATQNKVAIFCWKKK